MAFRLLKHCLGLRAALPAQKGGEPARPTFCDNCKQPLPTHAPGVEIKTKEEVEETGNDTESIINLTAIHENTHGVQSGEELDSDSDSGTESEDPNEIELDRRWAAFDAIPDSAFSLLVQRHMEKTEQPTEPVFTIEKRDHGSYNYVAILTNGTSKLVVKIPAIGLPDVWDPTHANIMRSEAHTLIYIKHRLPSFPCPTYITRDETFDNAISAPYLMLSFLEGQQSHHLWYPSPSDDVTPHANNTISSTHEALRLTFLTSLARTLAPLHALTFPQIGMLHLPSESSPSTITIVPQTSFLEPCPTLRHYFTRPTFPSSSAYYAFRNAQITHSPPSATDLLRAAILSTPAFTNPAADPFTLALDDLDLQNILVNPETGRVTGILDWDRVSTAPPSTGFSALPLFLQEDWFPGYVVPGAAMLFPWNLARYRGVYAEALKEACGGDGEVARWCGKSGMYSAVWRVMYGDPSTWVEGEEEVFKGVMGRIGEMRGWEYEEFVEALVSEEVGGVWEEGMKMWEEGVRRVFDPEGEL